MKNNSERSWVEEVLTYEVHVEGHEYLPYDQVDRTVLFTVQLEILTIYLQEVETSTVTRYHRFR